MDGILLIHKEAGMTSHDVVNRLRRILHMKKIGHSGTLDPDATGVLLVMLGKACKVLPYLEDTDKEYVASMELGKRTLTDDIWGEVLDTKPIVPICHFQDVLNRFLGDIQQVPPMISSVRVNGKKLYEYARANEVVERPIRNVHIYEIQALNEAMLEFRVACTSGTYVRSLCYDIAERTGNYGCMASLVRTKIGRFTLQDCVTLQEVEEGNYQLHTIEEVLDGYHFIPYTPVLDVYQGKKICLNCDEDCVVIVDEGKAIAVYHRDHDNVFRSSRGLW